MEAMLTLAIALNVANAAILALLATIYGRTALRTRAAYPLGLFLFSVLLLLHSAGTAAGYYFNANYFGDEAIPFMSVVGIFELAGLSALLKITI